MRTIALIFTLALLSVVSCNEDSGSGDVPLIYTYVFFSDSQGNDLTQSDTIFSIKNFVTTSNGLKGVELSNFLLVDDKKIWFLGGFGEYRDFIEFNGVDMDTIDRVVQPAGASNFGMIDKITYYYNGEEMETLDFIANPELKQEIEERNTQYIERETTNPFYVTLVKK